MFSYRKASLALLPIAALTACGGSGANFDNRIQVAPTSSSGYATRSSFISRSNQTISTDITLIESLDGRPANRQIVQVGVELQPIAGSDGFTVTVSGQDVTVFWDADRGFYYGEAAGSSVSLYAINESETGQVATYWAFLTHDVADPSNGLYGPVTIGINSNPAEVDALTGTATYNGRAGVAVSADDRSFHAYADGEIEITANFQSSTLAGEMALSEVENVREGDIEMNDVTILIDETSFAGNGFQTTMTVDPTDLGLASIGESEVSGQFYGHNGSDIGGSMNAFGTSENGTTALIVGAFSASR